MSNNIAYKKQKLKKVKSKRNTSKKSRRNTTKKSRRNTTKKSRRNTTKKSRRNTPKKHKMKGGASMVVDGIDIKPSPIDDSFKGLSLSSKIAKFSNKFTCN